MFEILDSVQSIIGAATGGIAGAIGSILGFIENILQFGAAFTCQEDYSCPETEQWSLGKGIQDASDFGTNMADTAKSVIDAISAAGQSAGDSVSNVVDGISSSLSNFGGGCDVGDDEDGRDRWRRGRCRRCALSSFSFTL